MVSYDSSDWYCTNCKMYCGLYSRAVLNCPKAAHFNGCDLCIHTECSFTSEDNYENELTTRQMWICPKYDFF